MILMNAVAKSVQVDDLQWSALLNAGRESGWTPKGCRSTLALPGADYVAENDYCACGQQITTEDARNLARALRHHPAGLATRLNLHHDQLEHILRFLENGGFVLTSDLYALSRNLGWLSPSA